MSEPSEGDLDQFDYFAWRKQAESFPCAPAKGLPKLAVPGKVLFRKLTAVEPAEIAAQLEQLVAETIGVGAHLLVARVAFWSDEASLANSLVALRDQHGWSLKRWSRGILNPPPFVRVGLRRVVARHAEDVGIVESVPMILGPFPHFPRSRYCPVPIFEMSVCADKSTKIDGKHRVNFLGIPMPKLSEAQRSDLIEKARAETATVNGGEDVRAMPGVTAAICGSLEHLFN